MIAGYPWLGVDGRTTLISLPGITLEQGYKEDCMDILDTMVRDMRNGRLRRLGIGIQRSRRPAVVLLDIAEP